MRLAWLSDIHLNFMRDVKSREFDPEYDQFVAEVLAAGPDAVLISGDIAEAPELCEYLELLETAFRALPIYFVLGNHDFYRGSIHRQRQSVNEFCSTRERLTYLTAAESSIRLADQTTLIGHDSWADARLGMYDWSEVELNDYAYIEELTGISREERKTMLNSLGDEAAEHLRRTLPGALASSEHVVFVTHVPPFLEACLYQGKVSSPEWAPHFSCGCVGEAIVVMMSQHPQKRLTVLCGHTHEPAEHHPLPNVTVLAAKAKYGEPRLQRILEYK